MSNYQRDECLKNVQNMPNSERGTSEADEDMNQSDYEESYNQNGFYEGKNEGEYLTSSSSPLSSSSKNNGDKSKNKLVCVVCGAPANGYNFDAITCESCKAFFRRNAFKPISSFECVHNNTCAITMSTRKKCKKCRIIKCFGLGMRRDWIMTDMEKEEKRKKIEENRKKKVVIESPNNLSLNYNQSEASFSDPLPTERPFRRRRRQHALFDERLLIKPNEFGIEPGSQHSKTTPEDQQQKAVHQTNQDIIESVKNCMNQKISLKNVELRTRLTQMDQNQIQAILEAYRQSVRLIKDHRTSPEAMLDSYENLTELGVRRIIFFFKLISDFRNLAHELMVKLLKQNMMNLIQIHGVNSYNRAENNFREPDSNDFPVSHSYIETIYGPELCKLGLNTTQNLYDLCDGDTTYIKILMLIILFDPTNENLTTEEQSEIKNLQGKYVTLIYAYMCEHFGLNKASLLFKSIIYEINKVNDMSHWFEQASLNYQDNHLETVH